MRAGVSLGRILFEHTAIYACFFIPSEIYMKSGLKAGKIPSPETVLKGTIRILKSVFLNIFSSVFDSELSSKFIFSGNKEDIVLLRATITGKFENGS